MHGPSITTHTLRLVLASSALLAACAEPVEEQQDVEITFVGRVGSEAYACGQSYTGIGTSSSTLTPSDFRFFVADLHLIRADGSSETIQLTEDGKWQGDGVALLDFDDGCSGGNVDTNDLVHGRVPVGDYVGLGFTLGIPFDRNHVNQTLAPPPLNISSMFWSWQAGYKFLRLDAPTSTLGGWRIHVGSTGCDGDTRGNVTMCSNPNRPEIILPNFDAQAQRVIVDLAALLARADLDTNDPDTPEGCMGSASDADCSPIFEGLGLVDGIDQSFFTAE